MNSCTSSVAGFTTICSTDVLGCYQKHKNFKLSISPSTNSTSHMVQYLHFLNNVTINSCHSFSTCLTFSNYFGWISVTAFCLHVYNALGCLLCWQIISDSFPRTCCGLKRLHFLFSFRPSLTLEVIVITRNTLHLPAHILGAGKIKQQELSRFGCNAEHNRHKLVRGAIVLNKMQ